MHAVFQKGCIWPQLLKGGTYTASPVSVESSEQEYFYFSGPTWDAVPPQDTHQHMYPSIPIYKESHCVNELSQPRTLNTVT